MGSLKKSNEHSQKADLILSNGTIFSGISFGADKSIAGEVVFNTGMVGYPEAFTDPSYRGQILVLTYPLIGKLEVNGKIDFDDPNKKNLVDEASCKKPIVYNDGQRTKILLIDGGVKYNIIRSLVQRNVTVIRVPWDYDFFNFDFDGVIISNGPGDPKMCKTTIKNIARVIDEKITIFGVCLGNQLLALAAGADTYKLKYGHRSQNQPCREIGTMKCYITTQNHGFAVDTKTLPKGWKPWFENVNDGTNEGIMH